MQILKFVWIIHGIPRFFSRLWEFVIGQTSPATFPFSHFNVQIGDKCKLINHGKLELLFLEEEK